MLACDIGGTKTVIGVFETGGKRPRSVAVETFDSREAAGIEMLIDRFKNLHPKPVSAVCMGIAGPVRDGVCRTTNLPWVVSETSVAERFGWKRVRLLNDLTATALAVPLLIDREISWLHHNAGDDFGNIGVVAPGTGLGMALLIRHGGRNVPVPSEGGHADFAPGTRDQFELYRYLQIRLGHVSIERVLSGPGLVHIFSWLVDSGRYKMPDWAALDIDRADPAKSITDAARDHQVPSCLAALNMFASILGAVCGNLALTGTTTGGIYLGGGIPPKIRFMLENDAFMTAFTDKGRFKDYLARIPVGIILNDKAALLGAACCAGACLRA